MLENDPRSDEYQDELLHHHAAHRGDVVAGWTLAVALAVVAAFALGLDQLAVTGTETAASGASWAGAAAPPLGEAIGLVPRAAQ
jgi:hypothetical protein